MSMSDFDAVLNTVSTSIKNRKIYDMAMSYVLVFVCEVFMLWQLVVAGFYHSYKISAVGIIGLVLIGCTYISLRIYRRTAAELEKHGEIIVNEKITADNLPTVKANMKRFNQVAEKYKAGKNTLLIMNIVSTLYITLFTIIAFVLLPR